MARTTNPNTCIVIDDEIFNMTWLCEYLETKGMTVVTAQDANAAVEVLEGNIYRFIVIDLNIPLFSPLDQKIKTKPELYRKFPGLLVAFEARNAGYRDRQIVIYSVHRDPDVTAEAARLGCTYIMKGRPRELKEELDRVVAYDPTT